MEPNRTAALVAAEPGALGAQPGASALFRQATDVAHVCREIVLKCVIEISGRRYVKVEGWMAISVAHGCIASIAKVENLPGEGVRAIAEVRRISDGAILATAEGFVGMDEPDWYGGTVTRWNKWASPPREMEMKLEKRSDHAIRAMAQTRGISRVLRAGFSHVVVLIDHKLSTVPAEEIANPDAMDQDHDERKAPPAKAETTKADPEKAAEGAAAGGSSPPPGKPVEVPRDAHVGLRDQFRGRKWEGVSIHFGKSNGKKLGELPPKSLRWWIHEWQPKPFGNKPIPEVDSLLRAALDVAGEETADEGGAS